ncbi:hypothetical protein AB0953_03045 [Streptomyces sp. NPDC046866]|uniref:hypothetical protein n=1 Tax=Streptomyces sp. NPDC046866 TaxID=3154921 RepID=UPI0034563D1D
MTWNQPYDSASAATAPASASGPRPGSPSMALRRTSGIAGVLLLPALVVAKVVVLMSETGSRCLMYGGCRDFPFGVFGAVCAGVLAAAAVVMAAGRRYQSAALAAQLLLEVAAVAMVVAYP